MKRALDTVGALAFWGLSEALFFVMAVREAYHERRTYAWPYHGRRKA